MCHVAFCAALRLHFRYVFRDIAGEQVIGVHIHGVRGLVSTNLDTKTRNLAIRHKDRVWGGIFQSTCFNIEHPSTGDGFELK